MCYCSYLFSAQAHVSFDFNSSVKQVQARRRPSALYIYIYIYRSCHIMIFYLKFMTVLFLSLLFTPFFKESDTESLRLTSILSWIRIDGTNNSSIDKKSTLTATTLGWLQNRQKGTPWVSPLEGHKSLGCKCVECVYSLFCTKAL